MSVGRGIKGPEHLPLAQALASALGAELAASRPICDAGWLPMERQIGSSGQTVAPKLYVAVGISGAIQHVVGMKGARTIVAVNKDADAPIFEVADYGYAGDLFEFLPALTAELKRLARRNCSSRTARWTEKPSKSTSSSLAAVRQDCRRRLRLSQLQQAQGGEPLAIAVLEKAREAGAHLLSGAVLDPSSLAELLPDFREQGAPIEADVHDDRVYMLDAGAEDPAAVHAAAASQSRQRHHLGQPLRQVAGVERVEAAGIDLFTGFPGVEVLFDGDRVVGVRTGDRGIGRDGQRRGTFEPGVDIHAKVTIFCDGVRGNLTKQLLARLPLAEGREPEQYAIGIKELWEVPADRIAPGTVIHTLGYPLRMEEFGGGFIYAMPEGRLALGLVVGLDYRDPLFDPHQAFQRFKLHPLVSRPAARRPDAEVRRQGAARRRMEHHPAAVDGRRAHRRRRGRVPEFIPLEGDSPGDEDGHARRRDRV